MTLLEEVKLRIRVKNSKFDEGRSNRSLTPVDRDMKRVGITKTETDPLVKRQSYFYCKANFGFSEDSSGTRRPMTRCGTLWLFLGIMGGENDAVP